MVIVFNVLEAACAIGALVLWNRYTNLDQSHWPTWVLVGLLGGMIVFRELDARSTRHAD